MYTKSEVLYTIIVDFRGDWGHIGALQVEKVYKSSLLAKSMRIFVFRVMENQLKREKFSKSGEHSSHFALNITKSVISGRKSIKTIQKL